jgi:phage baseplate assembly protein W
MANLGDPAFLEYTSVLSPDGLVLQYPPNILRDLNLLYPTYSSQFMLYAIQVIENMIYNVCETAIGSRYWEPEFGSDILKIIYDPGIQEKATMIEIELFAAVKRWVPYASLIFKQTVVVMNTSIYPDAVMFVAFTQYVDIFVNQVHDLELTFPRPLIG